MKTILAIISLSCIVATLSAWTFFFVPAPRYEMAIHYVKLQCSEFAQSSSQLVASIQAIDSTKISTIEDAKMALLNCRLHFKRVEFFLEYFFHSSSLVFNNPPKYEVEEPYIEFEEPRGLQVIESLLFDKITNTKKLQLNQQALMLEESAKDLGSLLFDFKMNDKQLLESLRLELIRILSLNITGYDAPLLKSGVSESYEALLAFNVVIQPYLSQNSESDSVQFYLNECLKKLQAKNDFDSFDRFDFLIHQILPLEHQFGEMIKQLNLEFNTAPSLNYAANNLFSADAVNKKAFIDSGLETNATIVQLGKKLFSEKSLSGNCSRSCATCHQPKFYFTDHLSKAIAYDSSSLLKRNTPVLLYTGFQHHFFWDGRAKTIEQQVMDVMSNPNEMHADFFVVEQRLGQDTTYQHDFRSAFRSKNEKTVSIINVARAIAIYLSNLSPMNSDFDQCISGDENAMSEEQKRGFNLFMGKAQCGTCHFAPLFNGLRPPLYNIDEFEVLGVPASDDFINPTTDKDQGRFEIFPVRFYKQAFKTPTVRNAAETAPYMHNGSFQNLETVLDFYNKGGGNGIGINEPEQTLSHKPIGLTKTEVHEIISFLKALTDNITTE